MRTAVVNQDRRRRGREGAADDMEENQAGEREPDGRPGLRGRGRGAGGDEREVGHEAVDDGEAVEEDAPGADRAEAGVDGGVEEEPGRSRSQYCEIRNDLEA